MMLVLRFAAGFVLGYALMHIVIMLLSRRNKNAQIIEDKEIDSDIGPALADDPAGIVDLKDPLDIDLN